MNAAPQPDRRGPQRMPDDWHNQLELNLGFARAPTKTARAARAATKPARTART
jgi:hypothetical protein